MREKHKAVSEGRAEFILPDDADRIYDSSVFYNPRMTMNRDLSVALTKVVAQRLERAPRYLELLSGSGIRGYRLLTDVPDDIGLLHLNDWSHDATQIIHMIINFIVFE